MVSAQEPVERNKSSLLQAVVWLRTRQSLFTDKLAMREDRSSRAAHRHRADQKSLRLMLPVSVLFIYEGNHQKEQILWQGKERKGKCGVFFQMDDQSRLVRKVIKTPMRVMRQSLVWGVWVGGGRNSLMTWNHQESWMVLYGGSRRFAEDKHGKLEILGDDVRGPRLWKGFIFRHKNEK